MAQKLINKSIQHLTANGAQRGNFWITNYDLGPPAGTNCYKRRLPGKHQGTPWTTQRQTKNPQQKQPKDPQPTAPLYWPGGMREAIK